MLFQHKFPWVCVFIFLSMSFPPNMYFPLFPLSPSHLRVCWCALWLAVHGGVLSLYPLCLCQVASEVGGGVYLCP
jgi:hypothetical protein